MNSMHTLMLYILPNGFGRVKDQLPFSGSLSVSSSVSGLICTAWYGMHWIPIIFFPVQLYAYHTSMPQYHVMTWEGPRVELHLPSSGYPSLASSSVSGLDCMDGIQLLQLVWFAMHWKSLTNILSSFLYYSLSTTHLRYHHSLMTWEGRRTELWYLC